MTAFNIDKKFNHIKFGDGNILIVSHHHMSVHADVYDLLDEAFSLFIPTQETIQKTVIKFDRVIGATVCVETTSDDEIIYATRKGRKWPSRMVKNRMPTPSDELTLVVKRCKNNIYRLLTAYIGGCSEREVDDHSIQTQEDKLISISFWSNHALIYHESDFE
jgi:hypothetical protein